MWGEHMWMMLLAVVVGRWWPTDLGLYMINTSSCFPCDADVVHLRDPTDCTTVFFTKSSSALLRAWPPMVTSLGRLAKGMLSVLRSMTDAILLQRAQKTWLQAWQDSQCLPNSKSTADT